MISKSVKIIVAVLLGLICLGQISNRANPPKTQPVVPAQSEAQERQEREAKWNAVNRGDISFCEAFKSDLQSVTGISKPCLSDDPTYRAVRDGMRDALRR